MTMARILWVHGFPDQALAQAECAIERARSINHSLSLCFALSVGCCPVAFWCGDLERAQRYTDLLRSRSKEYSLTLWGTYGEGYGLALRLLCGEPFTVTVPSQWSNMLREMLCTVHPDLASESSLQRGLAGSVPWSRPEVLRVLAARARRTGDTTTAERLLNEGLKMAAEHEALSWSLRCAMDLADMLRTSKSALAARSVLAPVYESFSEGWATADLKAAAAMLERLA
jgi:hypothetical protein